MSEVPVFPHASVEPLGGWTADISTLRHNECTLLQGILVTQIIWPRFVEVDGHVLREDAYDPDTLSHWRESTNENRQAVESVINHLHMYDLFKSDDAPLETFEYVAQVMLRTWKAALAEQFPDKHFEVRYVTEPDDYGPTIYVWQTTEGEDR